MNKTDLVHEFFIWVILLDFRWDSTLFFLLANFFHQNNFIWSPDWNRPSSRDIPDAIFLLKLYPFCGSGWDSSFFLLKTNLFTVKIIWYFIPRLHSPSFYQILFKWNPTSFAPQMRLFFLFIKKYLFAIKIIWYFPPRWDSPFFLLHFV